jgi:uncharacterized protein (TIGR04255 family)
VPIEVEAVELEHLPGSPLVLAIAQVRFLPVPAVDDPAHLVKFQEAIADDYDLVDRQALQQVVVHLGARGAQPPIPAAPATVWQFASRDGRWKVVLSQTSLALETDAYSTFADFVAELHRVLRVAVDRLPIKRKSRFGLRYVNEIVGERLREPGGLLHFFTPQFLPVGGELSTTIAESYSEVRFDEQDGSLVLRLGLVEPNKYLLDFDYFNETEDDFDPDRIVETATAYHVVIDSVFARAVTDEFMAEMKGAAAR